MTFEYYLKSLGTNIVTWLQGWYYIMPNDAENAAAVSQDPDSLHGGTVGGSQEDLLVMRVEGCLFEVVIQACRIR